MVSKQKILIVDDDNNIAELISLYLTKECFETLIANDGESVMPAMESFVPSLILLDIMLPGMDGYQVCREVRNKYTVPIIMLSAKGEIFDKVLGLELGADDYIEKPFDTKELVARAYGKGVAFFIHKPVNGVEVVQVLRNVIENIQMRRTFNQMQTIFMKDTAMVPAAEVAGTIENMFLPPQPEEKAHVKKLRNTLQLLGIAYKFSQKIFGRQLHCSTHPHICFWTN